MKKLVTLLLLIVGAAGSAFSQNSSATPDAYGYTWKNNNASGGPVYAWRDITTRGTRVTGLDDDNSAGMFNMGFTMKYYWVDVNRVKVGSNGWISFGEIGNIAHGFPNIPQADANANFVAPFMADLNFSSATAPNPGRVYYYTNNVDTMIISYENVPYWQNATVDFIGSNSFQVIFAKADNSITFQYKNMHPGIPNLTTFNDVVVGIENITQTIGMEVMKDLIPANQTAIKFYRPATSAYQVADLKANWNSNNRNGAVFGLKNQPMPVSGNVANVGNIHIGTPFQVRSQIRETATSAVKYTQTVNLPKLKQGVDTTYNQAAGFTPTQEGTYSLTSTIIYTPDANSLNNNNLSDIVVIDTTGKKPEVTLQYNDGFPESITGFGAGMYFKPPFYPTEVRTLEAYLASAQGTSFATTGFTVSLYAENPTTGGLGTLLFDSVLAASSVTVNATNSIEIPRKQLSLITSGGFYVTWVPIVPAASQADVFVGVDENPPFSFRTFEVQAGTLTDFRTADTEDFMIGAVIGTKITGPAGIKKDKTSMIGFHNVYPNPATDKVTLEFTLKENAPVELTITNVIGSKVKNVSFGKQNAGAQKASLNVANLKAGVYFCSLKVDENVVTKRLVITK